MKPLMSLELAGLCKGLCAAGVVADVRPLSSVSSQVGLN